MRLSFVLSLISIFFFSIWVLAEDYSVKKIEIEGLITLSKDEFIYLLGIREGQQFKVEDVTRGIKRLFLKGIFDDIVVTYDKESIKVKVKEKPIISEVKIIGNRYFSENFYNKNFPLKKGDRLKESQLIYGVEMIKRKLDKKGFVNFKMDIKRLFTDNYCLLELHVQEGEPIRVKDIKFTGDITEYIKSLFKIKPGDIFDQEVIGNLIKKIEKSFEKEGYIDSEIKYSFLEGSLILNVRKGKVLNIEILGAEYLPKKELKNIIVTHLREKVDDITIKDSINSLIYFYSSKGFKNVEIIPIVESKEDEWRLTYIINEKKLSHVKEIIILSRFSEEIKKILVNKEGQPINYNELEKDRQRIEEFLKSKGFYYVQISSPQLLEENGNVKIYFEVKEGQQVKISSIHIKGIEFSKKIDEILKKYENQPFNEEKIIEIKRDLRNFYLREGYSDIDIKANYEIINDTAKISFEIDLKEKKYFGKSVIVGNKKTKTNFIYQRLLPKEDQPFNPYLIDEERQILYSTGLFSLIEIKEQQYDKKVDLIYSFEELPAGSIELGIGYGEYERAKGFIDFSYLNLFGMNKQIFSRVDLNTLEKRIYNTYVDPWIGEKLSFKSSLITERADIKNIDTKKIIYKIRKYGLSSGFEKKFTETFKAELMYELNYSKTWDVLPEVIISDQDIGEILTSGFKLSLIYDSRDNPFDPARGYLIGVVAKLTSETFGSEINFLKASIYVNKYTRITKPIVLATSLRAGWAWLYGKTKELPISERYFLGGRDTVRGYAQNTLGPKRNNQPTGGNAFLMGNIELRTYLGKNLFLVNFLDFGNLWLRVGDVDPLSLKYTAGIGLRYKTPIGPLRVDYGYKLNREKGEPRGEVHFSIGHAF